MRSGLYRGLLLGVFLFVVPSYAMANVVISEVMYNPIGADDSHEWVELYNSSSTSVDISTWKIHDENNHVLVVPPKKGGRGSLVIAPNGYIILAADATTFITEHPSVNVAVIDTALSLTNTAGTIKLLHSDGSIEDTVSYAKNMGAYGDGNTLQRVGTSSSRMLAMPPTPGTGTGNSSASTVSSEANTIHRSGSNSAHETQSSPHADQVASQKTHIDEQKEDTTPTAPPASSTAGVNHRSSTIKWWGAIVIFGVSVGGVLFFMKKVGHA